MKKFILALLVACSGIQISTQQIQRFPSSSVYEAQLCNVNQDLTYEYRYSVYNFSILMYKSVAVRSNINFVYSPISIWIMLAAIAEGADPLTQQKLFQLLNLPNDPCIRQAYYQVATTRAFSSNDVNIRSTRVLLIDDGLTLSPAWYDFVEKNSLLEVIRAPIRYNPVATANEIKRIMSARLSRLNLSGNSVLLDTMDYNGLWTTAFADAVIERAPFYNLEGEAIGAVDIMRVQRRARMGYLKELHAKIMELPVGLDERYRMLFCVIIENVGFKSHVRKVTSDLVFEAFASLRSTNVPIDVAIPRGVIEGYISNPPALPTSFMQRSTLVLNNTGLDYAPPEPGVCIQPPYWAGAYPGKRLYSRSTILVCPF